jgi:hypothetical protein
MKGDKKNPTAREAAVVNQLDKTLRAICQTRNCNPDVLSMNHGVRQRARNSRGEEKTWFRERTILLRDNVMVALAGQLFEVHLVG